MKPFEQPQISSDLVAYFAYWLDRLEHALIERGYDARNVRAVLWERTGKTFEWLKPLEARLKLEALPTITGTKEFNQLATAFKRVRNIARELSGDDWARATVFKFSALNDLSEPAETNLLSEIQTREPRIVSALERRDYKVAFAEAAGFGPAVDRFFTEVFVMVEDQQLRLARLILMKRLESVILKLADVSEIVAEKQV